MEVRETLRQKQDAQHHLAMRLTPPGGLWAVEKALRQLIDHPELLAELRELAQNPTAASSQTGLTSLEG